MTTEAVPGRTPLTEDHGIIATSPSVIWLTLSVALVIALLTGLLEISVRSVNVNPEDFSNANIILEVLVISLCITIFSVRWMTRKFGLDLRSMVIASVFLSVGLLTLMRLLTFPSMPSMGGPTEDLTHSLYFGLISRYAVGVFMLAAAFIRYDRPATMRSTYLSTLLFVMFTATVSAIVLMPHSPLPAIYVQGVGVTRQKVYMEYGAMAILILAAIVYGRLSIRTNDSRFIVLATGLVFVIQAGFAHTNIESPFDLAFLLSRSVTLIGFFLIFIALVKTSLARPYQTLEVKTTELRALAQDLTERRLAEQALRKSEANYRQLVELAAEGIWKTDAEGVTTFVNPRMADMLGYSVEEMIGKSLFDFVADENIKAARLQLERRKSGINEQRDLEFVSKDGTRTITSISTSPITDDSGVFVGSLAVVMDITARKEYENEINRMNKYLQDQANQLATLNRELEAFSYSVSHDLRAPLRSIDGFSNALIEDYGDKLEDQAKDYLTRIRSGCQRMGELIDDMIKLSHVTRDKMEFTEVDLSSLVKRILEDLKKTYPAKKVKTIVKEGVFVRGDARLLEILMENLLGNAWKFTGKRHNPVIEFGVTDINDEKVYYIKDNGAGFNMAHADRLFVPFQRLHSTEDFPGTGIGLATAQRIVHRHGGRIWADGEVGKGATFYFTANIGARPSEVSSGNTQEMGYDGH